jgi:ATP-dependent DNA helicase RecQ
VSFDALGDGDEELPAQKLKVSLKLLKDGRLLRQNRKLGYLLTSTAPRAALYQELADIYAQKQERDRDALEQMVSYAVSGFCRWKLLLDYFGDPVEGFERCCKCDNCVNPPVVELPAIRDDEFEPEAQAAPEPPFEVGARVKVPKFEVGTVQAVAGDQVTIAFADGSTRTFLAEYVQPA